MAVAFHWLWDPDLQLMAFVRLVLSTEYLDSTLGLTKYHVYSYLTRLYPVQTRRLLILS